MDGRSTFAARVPPFVGSLEIPPAGAYASVAGGPASLYGTCYALLVLWYLGVDKPVPEAVAEFLAACQDPETGAFVGPELLGWSPPPGARHSREVLLWHLTCTALPVLQQFGIRPRYPLRFAQAFLDRAHLLSWLEGRNLRDAWLEGNNLLFVAQLLCYLRDVERTAGAQEALDRWFDWHDRVVDPRTGLWGSDRGCSEFEAMYGAYHQLLVYYHEKRPIPYAERLVDTVLGLQHSDGGFSPAGGGGACEDADAVDILVNLYKLRDYRRADIRRALRRCLAHLLRLQNADGGFPYRRDRPFVHMGIPATAAAAGQSSMFGTWFRVHTLALIAEVLTDEQALTGQSFRFSSVLSMGWHRPWSRQDHRVNPSDRLAERVAKLKHDCNRLARGGRRLAGRIRRMTVRR
jgi:hypothetical protein